MKNKNKTVWSNRFGKTNSKNFQRIGASINVDKRLYNEDIQASIVHVQMLKKKSIIPKKDGIKIIKGLKKIKTEIDKNKFKFKEKFEDIHQNIEKRLFQIIGDSAGHLHTARSRNDQVVTDLKLWMKKDNILISKKLKKLKSVLLQVASKNILITFPGLTHLQTAQPISAQFAAVSDAFRSSISGSLQKCLLQFAAVSAAFGSCILQLHFPAAL